MQAATDAAIRWEGRVILLSWIESNQELGRHPKTKKLARLLDMRLPEAVGTLHFLWWWALDFAQDGELKKYEAADIAEAVLYRGEPDTLIGALVEAGFIDKTDDGQLIIHDWFDYAGKLLEKRTKDRVRKQGVRNTPHSDDIPTKTDEKPSDKNGVSTEAAGIPADSGGIPTKSAGVDADGARSPDVPYPTVPNRTQPNRTLPERRAPDPAEPEGPGKAECAPPGKQAPPPPITRQSLMNEYGKALVNAYLTKAGNYGHTGQKGVAKAAEWLAADVTAGKIKPKPKKETSFDLDEYRQFAEQFTPIYLSGGDHHA